MPDSPETEHPVDSSSPPETVKDNASTASEPEQSAEEAKVGEAESSGPALGLDEVQASVEALLYAAGDPLSVRELKKAVPEASELIPQALERLGEAYSGGERGLQLVEVAGGFQITTRPEYHERVARLLEAPRPARISIQALETLAVIAYRQPITVPEIMELRGVHSAGVVRTLLEKKLVKIVGRKNVVGRPLLYGTTKEFLLRFGLKDLRDLPQLQDMSEIFGEEVAEGLEGLGGGEGERDFSTWEDRETQGSPSDRGPEDES